MNGVGPKYTLVDVSDEKYLHPMSEDNKFSSAVICHADDQSIMKSSPNSQPILSQLTSANIQMEMQLDGSVIKNEDSSANYVLTPYNLQ